MTEFAGQRKRRQDEERKRGVKALRELLAREIAAEKGREPVAASGEPSHVLIVSPPRSH